MTNTATVVVISGLYNSKSNLHNVTTCCGETTLFVLRLLVVPPLCGGHGDVLLVRAVEVHAPGLVSDEQVAAIVVPLFRGKLHQALVRKGRLADAAPLVDSLRLLVRNLFVEYRATPTEV